jgi:hypothetical protein
MCPSYLASHSKFTVVAVKDEQLPRLRQAFAREVKRNLFEAYLRPNETKITLVSNSISSSSCPGGEGLQFSPSLKGHHILAYNSSRIYVIDVRGPSIEVKRELKILRRPASACIKDDGLLLAVLSTEMQVDVYDLEKSPPKRSQSIILDHSPRTISLSPCGSVLAAAYEGGIEVTSLNPNSVTTERRAVKCDAVDALAFSFDGTQLLGTTIHSLPSNTVILTAPYYDPGSHMDDDNIGSMWTTSILFPNTSRDCSHAVLLQETSYEEAAWTFAYDRSFETFRAVRIDDLRNGTTYFTGPIPEPASQAKLLPCTLPSASYMGDLVSAGFQGKEVWLYGVPEDLDAVPQTAAQPTDGELPSAPLGRRNSGLQRSPSRIQESAGGRVPQWQVICDNPRNTLVGGTRVGELDGVSNVKWVAGFGAWSGNERLVITARGINSSKPITEEDDIDFIDGGRITLLDFDYGVVNGEKREVSIDVGTKEPEVLEEEQRDMATEVAIVRRRTVAQRRGNARNSLLRSATTASTRGNPPVPPVPRPEANENDDDDPLQPRRIGAPPPPARERSETPGTEDGETSSMLEEALDAPYSHASPRSGTTLRRAATAAAINRRLHPQAGSRFEYRRADGRAEHPHESDADNWVPPPPPYQRDDPGDLPAFMRHAAIAPNDMSGVSRPAPAPAPSSSTDHKPPRPEPANIGHWPSNRAAPPAIPPVPPLPPLPSLSSTRASQPSRTQTHPAPQRAFEPFTGGVSHQRNVSDSTTIRRPQTSSTNNQRPMSMGGIHINDSDMYDVSPPDSPRLGPSPSSDGGPDAVEASGMPGARASVVSSMSSPYANQTLAPRTGPVVSSPPSRPAYRVSIRGSYSNPLALNPPAVPSRLTPPQNRPELPPAPSQREGPPALELNIPSPTLSSFRLSRILTDGSSRTPSLRRLSNSATWPGGPPETAPGAMPGTGYPRSAPVRPGGPSGPHQLASLNNQGDSSQTSNRNSGIFQVQRVPVGGRNPDSPRRISGQQPLPPLPPLSPQQPLSLSPPPQPDEPLIISTPSGVSGAFDPPTRQTSNRRADIPLLAPVPQRPRPRPGNSVRPTVERLETIYSGGASGSNSQTWGNGTSARQPSLNRRKSRARARRSASRNMKEAKKRGWTAGNSNHANANNNSKMKKKKKKDNQDSSSNGGWTDVSASNNERGKEKDKKCVVM